MLSLCKWKKLKWERQNILWRKKGSEIIDTAIKENLKCDLAQNGLMKTWMTRVTCTLHVTTLPPFWLWGHIPIKTFRIYVLWTYWHVLLCISVYDYCFWVLPLTEAQISFPVLTKSQHVLKDICCSWFLVTSNGRIYFFSEGDLFKSLVV